MKTKTDNNFVRSGRERIVDDNYQTIDGRCMQALTETVINYGGITIVDVCSPQGSGILDWFNGTNCKAWACGNAMSELKGVDWVITNPPYKRPLVDDIIRKQIQNLHEKKINIGVAMLLRTGFDHAKTRVDMFRDCDYYAGQIKMMFRPKWFEDGDSTPIHNYVWHIWTASGTHRVSRLWYW